MPYQIKQPTSYEKQIEKLRKRGCLITDEPFCKDILARINYYRFSAYFLPFKQPDGNYLPDTNFTSIYRIYEFDRKMRSIIFSAIEEIEIFLRAKFAYYHAHTYGALGYMDAAIYNNKHDHIKFTELINSVLKNNKKVLFVQHHIKNYGGQFPFWVMTELFTFGMLSYFYGDLTTADQKAIAKDQFNTVPKILIRWLRCCTDLRNICAHYGRLYFRVFTAAPARSPEIDSSNQYRLFGAMIALKSLYVDTNKWNAEIYPVIHNLLKEYGNDIRLNHIGFPSDWDPKLRK
jgi:abortive infection bacteriophage resistance protein